MCNECGNVCWQAPPMTPEEQEALEVHIAKLIREQKDEGENPYSNNS